VVDEDSPAGSDSLGGNGALLGKQADTDETVGQLASGLFSDKFVAGMAAPEINATDLEKLAAGVAKELDQGAGVGAFRGLGGDPQKEFLKSIVGVGQGGGFPRRHRIAFDYRQKFTASRHSIFMILTSD
jgi:hypothetical protein